MNNEHNDPMIEALAQVSSDEDYAAMQRELDRNEHVLWLSENGEHEVEDIQDRNPMRGFWGKGEY